VEWLVGPHQISKHHIALNAGFAARSVCFRTAISLASINPSPATPKTIQNPLSQSGADGKKQEMRNAPAAALQRRFDIESKSVFILCLVDVRVMW
jgi:hypothetical protein